MDGQSSETAALAKTEQHPGMLMRQATDVAGVCKEIVTRTAQNIQGKKYVKVEGWQSIAVAYGCVASSRAVEKVEGGIRALGEVRRMSDGVLLATAEGFVGDDEKMWQSRPEYARRAMAQTRAISRACRSAFAFVVTMIDSSLSTTPAEEMDGLDVPASQQTVNAPSSKPATQPARSTSPAPKPSSAPSGNGMLFPNFGRAKGKPVFGADRKDLEFYANSAQRSLDDPSKSRWHDKERALLAAIREEIDRQDGNAGKSLDSHDDAPAFLRNEPPPPGDEDAPF